MVNIIFLMRNIIEKKVLHENYISSNKVLNCFVSYFMSCLISTSTSNNYFFLLVLLFNVDAWHQDYRRHRYKTISITLMVVDTRI